MLLMRRWFLSYNSQDIALMQAFEVALRSKDPEAHIFFAPKSLRAGGFWLPELARKSPRQQPSSSWLARRASVRGRRWNTTKRLNAAWMTAA